MINLRRALLALLLCLAALPALALELSFDLGVSDRAFYRYANELGPRQTTQATLGLAASDWLYLSLDFWNSSQLGANATQWWLPREQDSTLTADFTLGPVDLCLFGTIYALPARTKADIGAYYYSSIPLLGDLLALDNSLSLATDFSGLYAEASLEPSLSVPLALPLSISLAVKLGFVTSGYDGLAYTGLSHLMLKPRVSLSLDKTVSLSLSGGYSFDLSPAGTGSYPFIGGDCSLSFSDQK